MMNDERQKEFDIHLPFIIHRSSFLSSSIASTISLDMPQANLIDARDRAGA
jgi:hypothetical protein